MPGAERAWVIALLAIHAALALWGAAMNSVTFDENFHVPAGAFIAARRDFEVSFAQPPLAKTLCALPALALGAKLPPDSLVPHGPAEIAEGPAGEAFMRLNARRFHALYFAARCVTVLFSLALGWLVWRFARRLHGPRGALLAVALYAFAPEAIAHAGIAGVDVATGLATTAAVYAFWRFARTTRWRDAGVLALVIGLASLTRFSAIQLAPIFVLLALLGMAFGRLRRPARVWLVLALLPVTTLVIFNLGYLGQTSFAPLGGSAFFSPRLRALQQAWPGFRPPVPDAALRGLDYLSYLSQTPDLPTYLLGAIRRDSPWTYFPIALAVKWPLGFLGALGLRAARRLRERPGRKRIWNECVLLVPVAVVLGSAMVAHLNVGIRYVFPILPLLCVWCGGLLGRGAWPAVKSAGAAPAPGGARPRGTAAPPRARARFGWVAAAAIALAALQAVESVSASPWQLSFFNLFAGGPGGGYRIVNDSNVDWGQGLIALRGELKRRGIGRIHLAYHGTTDPAIYGIDYLPYLGGMPGPESDWIAISSYYFVGLGQRMMTPRGRTERLELDFSALKGRKPDAVIAGCMYLFRLR
jgi:4-amino-4-deoxy-L-arabinose transferase-like glycosyltransferase